MFDSGVAITGERGEGQSASLTAKFFFKKQKIWKKREERQNWEGSFTLLLLTDRAGYATGVGNN